MAKGHPMKKRRLIAAALIETIRFVLPVLVLCVGIWALLVLVKKRPAVPKISRKPKSTFVEVKTLRKQQHVVWVTAYGSVQAYRSLVLQPQVGGRVVEQSRDLIVGGRIPQDALVLKIDQSDYQAALSEATAAVTKAKFELKLEEGNQVVAQREWELLDKSIKPSELGKDLALRKPHLQEKRAALEAAENRFFRAKLDLDRTTILAPFNALVINETVEIGQIVNPQTPFATLVGTDQFQVQVSIPVSKLGWVNVPMSAGEQGSEVRVIHELGDGERIDREGRVMRLLGDVDPNGRMARILVSVDDPLGLKPSSHSREPLLIGAYVRVSIRGPVLRDVFIIPRNSLREGNRIWIKTSENTLEFRKVEIISREYDSFVVANTLQDGVEIVTSALPVAMEGMLLETKEDQPNGSLAKKSPASPDESVP